MIDTPTCVFWLYYLGSFELVGLGAEEFRSLGERVGIAFSEIWSLRLAFLSKSGCPSLLGLAG